MSEEIIKVLDYISDKLGIVVDWTTENALPYVEEIIGKFVTYNIIYHSVGLAIGIILLIVAAVLIKQMFNQYNEAYRIKEDTLLWSYYEDFTTLLGTGIIVVILVGVVAGTVSVFSNGNQLIQWSVIPEIALLKEIQYMVR